MVAPFQPESPLVSAGWLKDHLTAPDVRILDATWTLPGSDKSGIEIYNAQHIPGARFFDIDEIADTDSSLPHMLPPAEKFASRARRLGLGDGHRIVCYDQNNMLASARVWWMFRVMGHEDVTVLDGGFDAWRQAGGEVEDLPPVIHADRHFTARMRSDLVRQQSRVRELSDGKTARIVDARPADRFTGKADEPRPGLRKGHIPGSINIPHTQVLTESGQLKSADELKALFTDAGVDLTKTIVNTCGSGVSAAVLALAQAVAGHDDSAIYDGAWAEWGAEGSDCPVEAG